MTAAPFKVGFWDRVSEKLDERSLGRPFGMHGVTAVLMVLAAIPMMIGAS
jgi:hypothetical protein